MSVTDNEQIIITIPLFLKKLWKMVNDENAEDVIGWNAAGDGFVIYDQVRFITELLPQYFKHNNLASFVRQLNFYDFHKISNTLKNGIEFAHPYFLKDLPETLGFITRKCPNLKSKVTSVNKDEEINEILSGVKELKSKHHMVDNELQLLKQENAAIWSEINSLRMKYSRQTKIINKLIHFLITYIHSHQTSFSKQNPPVSKKTDTRNLKNSPQLLQIDYLNSKQSKRNSRLKPNIDEPSSSRTDTSQTLSTIDIENLLQETSEDFSDNYTVSYPDKQKVVQSTTDYPIEEILTDCDPHLEETSSYTVRFPKNKAKKLKPLISQISVPIELISQNKTNVEENSNVFSIEADSLSNLLGSNESKKKKTFKRKFKKLSEDDIKEDILKVPKTSQDINSSEEIATFIDNLNSDNQFPTDSSELENNSQTPASEKLPQSIEEFKHSPEVVSYNFTIPLGSIKVMSSPPKDVIKYNILENPKENLGLFLDNTQVQLGHLQEILNNLNAKEIVDLANCFNVSDSICEANDSETDNLSLISQELENELSKLPPEVSNSGTEKDNQVCSTSNSDLNIVQLEDDLFTF